MPIYEYVNEETGEVFEELRKIEDRDKPFISPDGKKCVRKISNCCGWDRNREVFQIASDYCKKVKPKNVKFRDGHTEKYDPTRHF